MHPHDVSRIRQQTLRLQQILHHEKPNPNRRPHRQHHKNNQSTVHRRSLQTIRTLAAGMQRMSIRNPVCKLLCNPLRNRKRTRIHQQKKSVRFHLRNSSSKTLLQISPTPKGGKRQCLAVRKRNHPRNNTYTKGAVENPWLLILSKRRINNVSIRTIHIRNNSHNLHFFAHSHIPSILNRHVAGLDRRTAQTQRTEKQMSSVKSPLTCPAAVMRWKQHELWPQK